LSDILPHFCAFNYKLRERTECHCYKQYNGEGHNAASLNSTDGIPDILKVPEGNLLVGNGYALGVQIYQVQRSANDPNVFS